MSAYQYPDLFNDVFGPVMQPGSSSHTAGPCRLGYLAHCLLQAPLKKITVVLDPRGSFSGTFGHMNEDLGMLAGAYGLLPDDERIFDIRRTLREENIDWQFVRESLGEHPHPNAVRFILEDREGKTYLLQGSSTGGGRIRTENVMGIPLITDGTAFVYISAEGFVRTEESETVWKRILTGEDGKAFYCTAAAGETDAGADYVLRKLTPVAVRRDRGAQLFAGFTEWIRVSGEKGVSLAETARLYETVSSGWSRERADAYLSDLAGIMERQTSAVYRDESGLLETPFSGYHFRQWRRYEEGGRAIGGSLQNAVIRNVLGVQALCRGVSLVPGPMGTGGGFLYAVLKSAAEGKGFSGEKLLEALWVAGGVGLIAYSRTEPTGEMTGCAGECGICGAMAAAALTWMAGGTPQQTEHAASLSLQSALGWACDPIPGGCNQPCFSRFMTAVVMAVTFADLALSGRDAVIPFDEVVDEMNRTGWEMSVDLKCTSRGGICRTPAARRCREAFNEWMKTKEE